MIGARMTKRTAILVFLFWQMLLPLFIFFSKKNMFRLPGKVNPKWIYSVIFLWVGMSTQLGKFYCQLFYLISCDHQLGLPSVGGTKFGAGGPAASFHRSRRSDAKWTNCS